LKTRLRALRESQEVYLIRKYAVRIAAAENTAPGHNEKRRGRLLVNGPPFFTLKTTNMKTY
jgi:hypothetical protein